MNFPLLSFKPTSNPIQHNQVRMLFIVLFEFSVLLKRNKKSCTPPAPLTFSIPILNVAFLSTTINESTDEKESVYTFLIIPYTVMPWKLNFVCVYCAFTHISATPRETLVTLMLNVPLRYCSEVALLNNLPQYQR